MASGYAGTSPELADMTTRLEATTPAMRPGSRLTLGRGAPGQPDVKLAGRVAGGRSPTDLFDNARHWYRAW